MFRHNRDDTVVEAAPFARGGVAWGAVLTGVLVAFGALFLLGAIVGGILAARDVNFDNVARDDALRLGLVAGAAFVVAQFVAYVWGGYTAGRMARGAGVANGVLVPVVAIAVGLVVGGIAAAMGANARLNLPFTTGRLPLAHDTLVNLRAGVGLGAVVAMFIGGMAGGALGARWHAKLERREGDVIDLTSRHETRATANV
jgi:hypothetical protein